MIDVNDVIAVLAITAGWLALLCASAVPVAEEEDGRVIPGRKR